MMFNLTRPQCFHFRFRMDEMRRIKGEYPEISARELNNVPLSSLSKSRHVGS